MRPGQLLPDGSKIMATVSKKALKSSTPTTTGLSPRLTEIIQLIAEGLPVKQVGRRLGLSPRTVEGYLTKLRQRVGAHNRAELIAHAARAGWLDNQ